MRDEKTISYLLFEIKNTEDSEYIIEGAYQALHYLYDLKEGGTYFFGKTFGNGYNAAVVAFKLNLQPNRTEITNNPALKIKLLDYTDLVERNALNLFINKFLEQNGFPQRAINESEKTALTQFF